MFPCPLQKIILTRYIETFIQNALKSKVSQLELQLNEADSNERRDTLSQTGEAIPLHSQGELCSEIARKVVLEKLKISLPPNSIGDLNINLLSESSEVETFKNVK